MVHKNKTYIPRQNYKFILGLKKIGEKEKGIVDNVKDMVKAAKNLKLVKKQKSGYTFGKYEFSTLADIEAKAYVNPGLQKLLWRSCLKAECGMSW